MAVVDAVTHAVTSTIALMPASPAGGATVAPASPTAVPEMPPRPMGILLSPDRAKFYVSNGRGRSVSEIDAATKQLLRTFPAIGTRPWGIAISSDGRTVYTANGPGGDVSFVDSASGKVTKSVALGGSPWGVVVIPAS